VCGYHRDIDDPREASGFSPHRWPRQAPNQPDTQRRVTLANQISVLEFPANIIVREGIDPAIGSQGKSHHGFFCGIMASSAFARISLFRRSAIIDGADWLPLTSS
jgi:hypothetical protein